MVSFRSKSFRIRWSETPDIFLRLDKFTKCLEVQASPFPLLYKLILFLTKTSSTERLITFGKKCVCLLTMTIKPFLLLLFLNPIFELPTIFFRCRQNSIFVVSFGQNGSFLCRQKCAVHRHKKRLLRRTSRRNDRIWCVNNFVDNQGQVTPQDSSLQTLQSLDSSQRFDKSGWKSGKIYFLTCTRFLYLKWKMLPWWKHLYIFFLDKTLLVPNQGAAILEWYLQINCS